MQRCLSGHSSTQHSSRTHLPVSHPIYTYSAETSTSNIAKVGVFEQIFKLSGFDETHWRMGAWGFVLIPDESSTIKTVRHTLVTCVSLLITNGRLTIFVKKKCRHLLSIRPPRGTFRNSKTSPRGSTWWPASRTAWGPGTLGPTTPIPPRQLRISKAHTPLSSLSGSSARGSPLNRVTICGRRASVRTGIRFPVPPCLRLRRPRRITARRMLTTTIFCPIGFTSAFN